MKALIKLVCLLVLIDKINCETEKERFLRISGRVDVKKAYEIGVKLDKDNRIVEVEKIPETSGCSELLEQLNGTIVGKIRSYHTQTMGTLGNFHRDVILNVTGGFDKMKRSKEDFHGVSMGKFAKIIDQLEGFKGNFTQVVKYSEVADVKLQSLVKDVGVVYQRIKNSKNESVLLAKIREENGQLLKGQKEVVNEQFNGVLNQLSQVVNSSRNNGVNLNSILQSIALISGEFERVENNSILYSRLREKMGKQKEYITNEIEKIVSQQNKVFEKVDIVPSILQVIEENDKVNKVMSDNVIQLVKDIETMEDGVKEIWKWVSNKSWHMNEMLMIQSIPKNISAEIEKLSLGEKIESNSKELKTIHRLVNNMSKIQVDLVKDFGTSAEREGEIVLDQIMKVNDDKSQISRDECYLAGAIALRTVSRNDLRKMLKEMSSDEFEQDLKGLLNIQDYWLELVIVSGVSTGIILILLGLLFCFSNLMREQNRQLRIIEERQSLRLQYLESLEGMRGLPVVKRDMSKRIVSRDDNSIELETGMYNETHM